MVLRKITIDNSVRYIPKIEQTKEIKQNTTGNKENKVKKFNLFQEEVNQTRENKKNTSQNNKKFLQKVTASGFKHLK